MIPHSRFVAVAALTISSMAASSCGSSSGTSSETIDITSTTTTQTTTVGAQPTTAQQPAGPSVRLKTDAGYIYAIGPATAPHAVTATSEAGRLETPAAHPPAASTSRSTCASRTRSTTDPEPVPFDTSGGPDVTSVRDPDR